MTLTIYLTLAIFIIGYAFIILEHLHKVNKASTALLVATACWSFYFIGSTLPIEENIQVLSHHVSEVSQIVFFLLGAMAIVELIDAHRGFKIITNLIDTKSRYKMLWIIGIITFFMSAVLDNLTSTIVIISLLRKLVPDKEERMRLGCMAVIAANAGGAWTPIGDVTTTMLWIDGQITAMAIMKALFIPSCVSLVVSLGYQSYHMKKTALAGAAGFVESSPKMSADHEMVEPKGVLIFILGIFALMLVPVLKALIGLPPFMGILIGLGCLWAITDIVHHDETGRHHLRVPHILSKIDTSGILFFLGILLSVKALETEGVLSIIAHWLDTYIVNQQVIAGAIGILSAIIDNVPLVAACMGMYDTTIHPANSPLWEMIAYCAGTGGSILIIGSAAGVALMGLEKVDFIWYFKKVSLTAFLGYLAGFLAYILLNIL